MIEKTASFGLPLLFSTEPTSVVSTGSGATQEDDVVAASEFLMASVHQASSSVGGASFEGTPLSHLWFVAESMRVAASVDGPAAAMGLCQILLDSLAMVVPGLTPDQKRAYDVAKSLIASGRLAD